MRKRHFAPLPRLWLMTDERMGAKLIPAISRLPKGSGVVFRHYSLPKAERMSLLLRVERITRARRLTLLVGGRDHHRRHRAVSAPVHSIAERIAAERRGATLLFVSPVFATASHPDARPLGRVRLGMLIRNARRPVIALGGMNRRRANGLAKLGVYGWAAIDSLS